VIVEFEILEEYVENGRRRFRVRVRDTLIVFNVEASNVEEAMEKAKALATKMNIQEFLKHYSELKV